MKSKKKKGFTLVELLVVIAILAILATVTVVGYTSFTDKAKKSVAETEAKQVEIILYGNGGITGGISETVDDVTYSVTVIGAPGSRNLKFSTNALETGTGDVLVKVAALEALFPDLRPLDRSRFEVTADSATGEVKSFIYIASNGISVPIDLAKVFK